MSFISRQFRPAALALLLLAGGQWAIPLFAATTNAGTFIEETIGGTWNEAVGLTFSASGQMFVWERGGRVWPVENGVKQSQPLIDISEEVGAWHDHGLMGFALHPDFLNNGYIYLLYVVDHYYLANYGTPNYNSTSNDYFRATIGRITRYTARSADHFHSVDPNSRFVLLGESSATGFPILYSSHGLGSLVFGEDGTLLASCGDGGTQKTNDMGSAAGTYYAQGIAEGIIQPKENVGSFRAQLTSTLAGKIIRLDPATGDGIPSNPFYDSAHPRAARSRLWALGLRQPFRMTLRPGTGSHFRNDGRPGVIYIGDVGWLTWEELDVCDRPGMNFGWPLFEGLEAQPVFSAGTGANQDAPNPLFGVAGCAQQFFSFGDLVKQATLGTVSWPNPCDASQPIPNAIDRFFQTRPVLDWKQPSGPARTGIFTGTNAAVINIGASGSPVSGPQFAGNCSIGGVWYTNSDFPSLYRNTYFHADYGAQWIKNIVFDENNVPVQVRDFSTNVGGIVFLATHPIEGGLYYIRWTVPGTSTLRRIRYVLTGNLPPIALASLDKSYGPAPLTVQFTGSNSLDPQGLPLTFRWDFGDGSAISTNANPLHVFDAPAGVPTRYDVTLQVANSGGLTNVAALIVSVNNTPPAVAITSPIDGSLYPTSSDTTYNCTAVITDAEEEANQLSCVWQTILHHNNHTHNEPVDTNCATTTVLAPAGCDGGTYFYSIILTVTDAAGLSTTNEARLYPDCNLVVPVITWTNLAAIPSGTALGTAQLNATANVTGTFAYNPPPGTVLSPGSNQMLSVTFTPADPTNYTTASASVMIDVFSPIRTVQTVLIASNAVWSYLDNGSNQSNSWSSLSFKDSAWAFGPAQLGYGSGKEATIVSFGPNASAKYITTYFRRRFTVSDPSLITALMVSVQRDDGAVVYLNGLEVFRSNMPPGPINYLTVASSGVSGTNKTAFHDSPPFDPGNLVAGTNVMAVEVHQRSGNSSAMDFNLQLLATNRLAPPLVSIAVNSGAQVLLQWNAFAGQSYRVQYASDPSTNFWNPLGRDVTATNSTVLVADPLGALRQRFYRVLLLD